MARKKNLTTHDEMHLDAIAKHLKVKSRYADDNFIQDIRSSCLAQIAPVIQKIGPCTGEDVAMALADHFRVKFEEVHTHQDVTDLENRYLKEKGEIGFAQLRSELNQPGVDALLFERMNAKDDDTDRWVAVLNLQDSEAKAYWNRFHELSHRIAEPPQQILPFKRHKDEAHKPVEALMDSIASEIAFFGPLFKPIVQQFAKTERLSFEVVEAIRSCYAPTASLLSTMKAVVKYWPRTSAVLTAEFRGRRNQPMVDQALRINIQAYSPAAILNQLKFWPNMRVPVESPMDLAFKTGALIEKAENLGCWNTSSGDCLPARTVHTSARRISNVVYALISA